MSDTLGAILGHLPAFLGVWDLAALILFFAVVMGLRRAIEHCPASRPSTSHLMERFRRDWMRESPNRVNRMVDASLLVSQRTGASFFASGAMIAIGGLAALLGQADRLVDVAQDIVGELDTGRIAWEVKLVFLMVLTVDAFLKFVWSHRVFGYCAVLLGAIPENGAPDEVDIAVERAARLNISAGRSFNRGLRSVYFILAAMAWFLGPAAFMGAVLFTAAIIYRREFLSSTRDALVQAPAPKPITGPITGPGTDRHRD